MFDPKDADRCRITRDEQGTDDDTLDPSTLALTPPTGDKVMVYEGPCKLSASRGGVRTSERSLSEGGTNQWSRSYTLGLPLSAPLTRPADDVEMLASRNPMNVGLELRVIGPTFGTTKLSQQVECETRTGGA